MTVTVRDLLGLPSLGSAQLVAGAGGLDRVVRRVSAADNPTSEVDQQVASDGDFYLTGLYLAKDSPAEIAAVMAELDRSSAAGVCVIDEYVDRLPTEVIAQCDDLGLPVLFIDRLVPYAQVICEVMELVISDQRTTLAENRIDVLRDASSPEWLRAKTIHDLCPRLTGPITAIYATYGDETTAPPLRRDHGDTGEHCAAIPYRGGLLTLTPCPSDQASDRLTRSHPDVVVGSSTSGHSLADAGRAIDEAMAAAQAAMLTGHQQVSHDRMGVWGLILLAQEHPAVHRYADRILEPLRAADSGTSPAHLVLTSQTWLDHGRDVAATAQALFVHDNTVRYRLAKVRELMQPLTLVPDPFEEVALALRITRARSGPPYDG